MGRIPAMTGTFLMLVCWAVPGLAQQPGQRILPRTSAPASGPRERVVCAPELDEATGLFSHACKEFHDNTPSPDWLARRLFLIAAAARGPFDSDLPEAGRAEYDQLSRPRKPLPLKVGKEAFLSSRARWRWYRDAVASAAARDPAMLQAAPLEPVDKREYFPDEQAPVVWSSSEAPWSMAPPWTYSFTAKAGEVVGVAIDIVKPAPGYWWPDPVVWLVRVEEPGDPERGLAVARSDDEENGLPALSHTVEKEGVFRVIVAPYSPANAGFASVTISRNDEQLVRRRGAFFGGVPLYPGKLAPGDLVLAGADGPGGAYDHDATLTLLPAPWATLPAPYAASNNELDLLPLLLVNREMTEPVLLAGAYRAGGRPAVRVVTSRIAPSRTGDGEADRDGDLLSADVEAVLGTKEKRDSDNDGLTDFEEVFGARRCYADAPVPPYFRLPECTRDHTGRCEFFCSEGTALEARIPLSAVEAPDPTRFDIFVEFDYWQGEGEHPGRHSLPDDQLAIVKRAFERDYRHEEGGGKTEFTPSVPATHLHFLQDDPIPLLDPTRMAYIPANANRYLFFDLFFTPDRKYTSTFHYVVGTHRGAGQSDVLGRTATIGVSGRNSTAGKLVHEMGHLVGLLHNRKTARPSNSPFYLSSLSYGYSHSLPGPIDWDGAFLPCRKQSQCPKYFKCTHFGTPGKLCAPDCGVMEHGDDSGTSFPRFSAGELQLPPDTSEAGTIPEQNFPAWFLPYLYCYRDAGRKLTLNDRLKRFVDPACASGRCVQCDQGMCSIDWDHDGTFQGVSEFDLDRDGRISSERLLDGNDREIIAATSKRGLRPLFKKTIAAFYSGFTGLTARNVLPFPSQVVESHGGYMTDVTNRCDEVARWSPCRNRPRGETAVFRGPASGDGPVDVLFPAGYCLPLESGAAFGVRVKPLQIPSPAEPAVILDSPGIKLLLSGEPDMAIWEARLKGVDGKELSLQIEDPGALGNWTRLSVSVSNGKSLAVLSAKRGTVKLRAESEDFKIGGEVCSFAVGSEAGGLTRLIGFIDDPMFMTGPVRE